MKKLFLLNTENGIKKMNLSFDELYDHFFNMIQDESWKLVKVYSTSLSKDEVEQQFTIELWYAFENYDITTGNCVSTFVFNRFKKAKRDLLYPVMNSKKEEWKREKTSSLTAKISEDDRNDFSNNSFENDEKFQQMENGSASSLLENEDLVDLFYRHFSDEKELDAIRVLMDRTEFSVQDYATKWNISRMGAHKRIKTVKEKMAKVLVQEWL